MCNVADTGGEGNRFGHQHPEDQLLSPSPLSLLDKARPAPAPQVPTDDDENLRRFEKDLDSG
ncbi:hypothetical protein E2C01_010924 [Portunus trituberculatus]|uniref:Uncharacterized protein n=1 Tax=Portunus trituberculatus TaxID=210409 RepID=A0A5B7D9S2_PORTR|nr:hypothetical protein [Portunus trituberculatus]